MVKISNNQLIAMLLITDTFSLLCFRGQISIISVAGFIIGILIQFIMLFPLIKMYNSNNSINDSGKILQSIYLIYLLMWGGILFSMLWKTSDAIRIPYENIDSIYRKLLIAGLIAIVCLYVSSSGLKAVSRSVTIAFFAGMISLLIVTVNAMLNSDWNNLFTTKTSDSFISEISRGFFLSGGLGSFAIFMDYTKGNPIKNTIIYFISKTILTIVITTSSILITGGIMEITEFPILTASQLSQPFSVQRIDSLFLIMFSVFGVFSIAIQSIASSEILLKVFPDFKHLRTTFVLSIMIGMAFLFSGKNNSIINIFSMGIILFVLPLIIQMKNNREKSTVK